MAHDEHDDINPSANPHIADIVAERIELSRRGMLMGTAAAAALTFVGAPMVPREAAAQAAAPAFGVVQPGSVKRPTTLGFRAVGKSLADTVTVAEGYSARPLFRLGDPMAANIPAYKNDGTDAAATYAMRAGDHHDAITYFGMNAQGGYAPSNTRGLLAMNHEAITPMFLHPNGVTATGTGNDQKRTVADEVMKEFYVHGVAIVEVERAPNNGAWSYKQDSRFNRRITTLTPIALSGPAATPAYMATKFSPQGTQTRGTLNNCANGYTPWNTYLTCEENSAGYFRRIAATDDPKRSAKERAGLARYGVAGNGRELWATITPDTADNVFGRWNAEATGAAAADDYRNAPNTYLWNVEIDPFNPDSMPKKRTAMGRMAHEGAWLGPVIAGRPLVWYMGDDSRGEYIYKYVSTANWDPADATRGAAAGDKYLDNGRLYVAKFNADGTGEWLELRFGNGPITAANATYPFADQADVLVHARLAADALGATKMDRPEWGAVDPVNGQVYMTLTNNNAALRPLAALDAANPRHYNDRRTNGTNQYGNPNGHIIRWQETGDNAAATTMRWDIYLFGARAGTDPANVNLSGLTAENDFSAPDGLWFSNSTGLCWIQTDDGAYTDVTNCMLLAALPGQVGDGGRKSVLSTNADGQTREVATLVGAPAGDRVRRFLVGPAQCEITGITETPDGRTLFVNIQHPGEDTPVAQIGAPANYGSHWPDGGMARPRSATIVITKNDGGVIGV
jgi:secreted PhoX family phosphatase